MLVIFEGADNTGKDYLRYAFERVSKYKYVTCARLHLSCLVYAKIFHRPEGKSAAFLEEAKRFFRQTPHLVVYLMADRATRKLRSLNKGEDFSKDPSYTEYDEHFWKYVKAVEVQNLIVLDTSCDPNPEAQSEIILDCLRRIQ